MFIAEIRCLKDRLKWAIVWGRTAACVCNGVGKLNKMWWWLNVWRAVLKILFCVLWSICCPVDVGESRSKLSYDLTTEGDECIPHWKGSEKTKLKVSVNLCAAVIAAWMNLWEIVLCMPEGMAEAEGGGREKALDLGQITMVIDAVYVQAL